MASRLELLTMREVYREIVSDLTGFTHSDLYSKYKNKFLDVEKRLQDLRRGANVVQKTQKELSKS